MKYAVVLRYDTRRLKTRVQGLETVKSIDLTEVLDSDSKEDLLKSIIRKHLILLFYAKPSLQFDYLSKVIGVEVKSDLRNAWIELKATRDLIIHSSGIINEIYL